FESWGLERPRTAGPPRPCRSRKVERQRSAAARAEAGRAWRWSSWRGILAQAARGEGLQGRQGHQGRQGRPLSVLAVFVVLAVLTLDPCAGAPPSDRRPGSALRCAAPPRGGWLRGHPGGAPGDAGAAG